MTTKLTAAVFAAMASVYVAWVQAPMAMTSPAYVEAGVSYDASLCASAPEVAGPLCGVRGDDDGDGVIREDESGWDCATMGNRVCGRLDIEQP